MATIPKVEGLEEVMSKLNDLESLDIVSALKSGGYVLMAESMKNTVVVSGFLQSSYSVEEAGEGVELVNSANYAYYQEYGTSKMQPRGMVRKAIQEKTSDILEAVSKNLEKQIKEVAK